MSVLFISSSFFGYATHIKKELEKRFENVLWYEDRPSTSFLGKVKTRLLPSIAEKMAFRYFKRIADENRDKKVREVFVIKGESLSVESIKYLRKVFPDAIFRLYFWDGYKNMPSSSFAKVDYFDVALSFDPVDVKNDSRLKYRPLFFIRDYQNDRPVTPDIDLLFVGTAHTDRYKIVKKIDESLAGSGVNFHKVLYCPSRIIYWARRVFDPSFWSVKKDDFIFKPISHKELSGLMSRAGAILDIERTAQTGFTMRTLEILGSARKLITTNPSVLGASFYDPKNVLAIDRKNPAIPKDFLRSPRIDVDKAIIAYYSIAAWADEIFGALPKIRAKLPEQQVPTLVD
ncbi:MULTISPECIES: hypothetical protein [Variovorax]|uniref:Lipopolysaccharide biosynthesis protein n=1 Tax=Variovorax paradoxus TaxID=34073 RepID=A0AAE4BXK8_VARPD|nr:hypothetical protein [Variovorax paradoxus]MDR6428131.1 hypothetical protein [Variovorax paradoxus]